ncbi:MAG: acetylglutamate kinase [Calditrichaceae bacterium]|nr:acetylglutamate kinase [Calditrichaceae bacterium]
MQKLTVVKIGGKLIDDQQLLKAALTKFAQLAGYKILIHGGGKIASDILNRMGIKPKMINGRRITDEQTLQVVKMVYAGLINKDMVAALQALNCNALGMCGADGSSILAHKRPVKDIDYGFAGDVDKVNFEVLSAIINCGLVPVFCALTHDGKGQILNTNADTIATEISIALARKFNVTSIFTFEKNGVLEDLDDENSVIGHINESLYEKLKNQGKISEGMIPKLDNIFRALKTGVEEIYVTSWLDAVEGTRVTLN